jgi:transcription initiation factor TFIIB
VIYRRALAEDLLPGRSIEAVATASLYAAARQIGVPRTVDEVATVSRIDEQAFKRAYRYIVRELSLEIEPPDSNQYVPRFTSDLGLSAEMEWRASRLLDAAQAKNLHSGRNPVGLAAAAIYAASLLTNEPVTQREVSEVADISTVTIRNRYRELLETKEASEQS